MSRQPNLYWATFALIFNEKNEILLSQRQNTWYYDGGRNLPAWHIEAGETATESMRHECLEELGITIDIDTSHVFHVLHRLSSNREYFDVGISITKRSWDIVNNEPERCSAIGRFALDNLPEYISPSTIRFIEAYKNWIHYSEMRETIE